MRALLAALVLLVAGVAAGCGEEETASGDEVVASFYPVAWALERIVGDGTDVVNLTPPGAEPHDLELSPRDVETIHDARLVVYLGGGFQPALEDAVAQREGPSVDLLQEAEDPHIWLDPVRFRGAVRLIADGLDDLTSSADVVRDLRELHGSYERGLARCDRRTFVTTHASFGALAERYGLTQLSIAGRSPEAEPGPRELEETVAAIRASGATTVFAEPLVSDRLARTVAREAGVEVAVLDPLEGLSQERLDAGEDYLSVMKSNLETLRKALGCR